MPGPSEGSVLASLWLLVLSIASGVVGVTAGVTLLLAHVALRER